MRLPLALVLLLCASPALAQEPAAADAYRDPGAAELVRLARARRAVVDTRITRYEVTAQERMSARMAAAGMERLLFRRETVARIDWTRDTVRIEVLGAREAQPTVHARAQLPPADIAGMVPSLAFDPVDSEMLLRFDSTVARHPLAAGSEAYYRFSSGGTTSIRLPGGRVVRLLELRIIARRADPQLINGSFWLDAETHGVVRAAFRLSRGISTSDPGLTVLVPEVTAELDHVAIDYGLWDLRWWLPRTVVARGVVRAAGVRFPLAYERSYEAYRVEGDTLADAPPADAMRALAADRPCRPRTTGSIVITSEPPRDSAWAAAFDRTAERVASGVAVDTSATEGIDGDTPGTGDGTPAVEGDTLAGGRAEPGRDERCDRAFLVTRAEPADLTSGDAFPGSIYEEAEGPVSPAELEALAELARGVPTSPWSLARPSVRALTPELVRFNRVEGLSLGARAELPLGPAGLSAEVRAGTTGEIGARLSGVRATPALHVEGGLYRDLEAVDVASQPFSLASSASALLLGRDENDYFRANGAELRLSPAPARRRTWNLRLFAERQEPVRTRSDLSGRGLFDEAFAARPNLAADRLDQAGATLRVRAARGDDPSALRTRVEVELHAETGDRTFARPLLRLGADRLLGGNLGAALALTAGTGLGDVPAQRAWQIGGATTVRGHDAAVLRGESLWLARGELTRGTPLARLAVFGDLGWAGESDDLWSARPLRGAGIGISVFDNLLRLDLARGIGGGGYRLHLRMGGAL